MSSSEFEDEFERIVDEPAVEGDAVEDRGEEVEPSQGDEAADAAFGSQETQPAQDPWAEAPAHLKLEYEKAQHAARSNAGRVAAYQQQLRELQEKLQQPAAAPQEDPEWALVREEYPDVVGPVAKRLDRLREEVVQQATQEAIKALEAQAYEQQQTEENIRSLASEHPDYLDVLQSSDFNAWAANVSPNVRKLVDSPSVEEASIALHLFKSFREAKGQRREAAANKRDLQKESAYSAPPTRTSRSGRGPSEDTYDAWFDFITEESRR